MFMEMFKMADLVIFNRCDDNTNMGSFRRSIKAVNPRAQVGFERADGKEMAQDELLPYDVNADVIKVEDEDYGIWYIDAMELQRFTKERLWKCVFSPAQSKDAPGNDHS